MLWFFTFQAIGGEFKNHALCWLLWTSIQTNRFTRNADRSDQGKIRDARGKRPVRQHNLDTEIALIKHGISNTTAAPSPHFHLLYFLSQTTEDREQEAHHRSENMV